MKKKTSEWGVIIFIIIEYVTTLKRRVLNRK